MARGRDARYIQFYTDGSSARKVVRQPGTQKRKVPKPRQNRQRVLMIRVDPLAVCAIAVAAVLLILMVAGCVQTHRAEQQQAELERYLADLTARNASLMEEYQTGYDPETVRQEALTLGLIPVEEAQTQTIQVEKPTEDDEMTSWEWVVAYFKELFS